MSETAKDRPRALSGDEQHFLVMLHADRDPGPVVSRAEDRARQRLRRDGYVVFDRKEWCWHLTSKGRLALRPSP